MELENFTKCKILKKGYGFSGLSLSNVKVVIGFGLSVLFIYIFVLLITWYLDSRTARQLTDDLKIFQNENEQ